MAINPQIHHRRSIRLKEYDYSQAGGYFVTVCTHGRDCILGDIVEDNVRLNQFGEIVREEWLRTEQIRPEIRIDEFVVMPNHMHGVIIINYVGATRRVVPQNGSTNRKKGDPSGRPYGPAARSIGAIIGQFKSIVTKHINSLRKTSFIPIWQRNYYEYVIRDEDDLNRIRQYIIDNPIRWDEDENNPKNWKK
jgi:REP element-mobilizing transposase RayT